MSRQKEEFSRKDPKSYSKFYVLRLLNWLFPFFIITVGFLISTQKFAALMNYDEFFVGKPIYIFTNGYRLYSPGYFLLGIIKYISNQEYRYYFFEAFPPIGIAFIIAFLLIIISSILLNSHQKNQHIYGTARWAFKRDLKEVGHLQKYGVVCGQLEEAEVYSKLNPDPEKANIVLHIKKGFFSHKAKIAPFICHSGALNTWMIAPTGSGKGVGTIIPTCLNYGVPYWARESIFKDYIDKLKKFPKTQKVLKFITAFKKVIKGMRSLVCFDPKGENFEASAGWRSKFSVIVPFRPLDEDGNTAHYNPICEIPENPKTAFSWADMIAEIFFGLEKKGGGGDETSAYFANKARDIFTAVVLHVRFSPDIPWEKKNMSTVLSFMSEASNDGQAGRNNEEDDENEGCGEAMLAEMIATDHIYPEINDIINKAANRSKAQPAKERGSTYSTVFSKISLFQDPLIAEATAYSDFSVDDFIKGDKPISLYLIVPYNHIDRIAPVFRMLITFMIKKFSDGTTNANSVKLKNPCLFLLDEFPVLGYFPDIAQNMGILRGYGVSFFIVSQSKQQMQDTYGENHPFFGHCKTKIIYAPNEPKDAKEIAEIIGNRSVLLDNKSTNMGSLGAGNLSSQEVSVNLINADELMKLEFSRCIVLLEGKAAYKGKKVVYYEDPRFKDKAFLPIPDFECITKRMKTLPSNKIVRKVEKTNKEIAEGIDVQKSIPSDYDIFND